MEGEVSSEDIGDELTADQISLHAAVHSVTGEMKTRHT